MFDEEQLADSISTGSTIDDYLISIADGVAQAQRRLTDMVVPGTTGQPAVRYQIPRVDFELRMAMNMQEQPAESPAGDGGAGIARRSMLRVQAVQSSAQASVASTIKGSIVAVPANSGKPEPVLDVRLTPSAEPDKAPPATSLVDITVLVTNTAGEPLIGEEVQVNIDRDLSEKLNKDTKTYIESAVVKADKEGVARTRLVISDAEPPGAGIAVTVDAVRITRTVIYRVPAR